VRLEKPVHLDFRVSQVPKETKVLLVPKAAQVFKDPEVTTISI
jgi:hypothetical protein